MEILRSNFYFHPELVESGLTPGRSTIFLGVFSSFDKESHKIFTV